MNKQEFLDHLDKCMESLSRSISFQGRKTMIAKLAKVSSSVEKHSSDKQTKGYLTFLADYWCGLNINTVGVINHMVANMYKTLRDVYCGRT